MAREIDSEIHSTRYVQKLRNRAKLHAKLVKRERKPEVAPIGLTGHAYVSAPLPKVRKDVGPMTVTLSQLLVVFGVNGKKKKSPFVKK